MSTARSGETVGGTTAAAPYVAVIPGWLWLGVERVVEAATGQASGTNHKQ